MKCTSLLPEASEQLAAANSSATRRTLSLTLFHFKKGNLSLSRGQGKVWLNVLPFFKRKKERKNYFSTCASSAKRAHLEIRA